MDAIKQWAFSICATMVVSGIAISLMPKTNLSKIFRLVVSMFFLCCLLSPVIMSMPDIKLEYESYSQPLVQEKADKLSIVIENQTQNDAYNRLEKIIGDKLKQMGINYHSITININTNGQSETAGSVTVELDEKYRTQNDRIKSKLDEAFGLGFTLSYV